MAQDITTFVKKRLKEEVDEKFRKFSASLIPNINNVLGVRLPVLRKIAKEIYKKDYKTYLNCKDFEFMEETMLKGMVIGLIKDKPENLLPVIADFVNEIDNWSVCDSFCCGLKFVRENKTRVWKFLQPYLSSKKEYEIRFGCVMLLNYFAEEEYLDRIFDAVEKILSEDYYAKMSIAWLLSICFIKQPERTMAFLRRTNDIKQILKTMKR